MMTPPAPGTFGTMGRNTFRDFGFRNVDFSTVKNFSISVNASSMQFRAEFFNIFNHPNFANPFGGQNGWGHNDPSVPGAGWFRLLVRDSGRRGFEPGDRFGRKPGRAARFEVHFLTLQRWVR